MATSNSVPRIDLTANTYVDTGIEKSAGYNPRARMETLMTSCITKASARQRAGRAGRTKPGVCYRLYTQKTFLEDFAPDVEPRIRSTTLAPVFLRLMCMKINPVKFDFIDPPDTELFLGALQELNVMYVSYTLSVAIGIY